MELIIISVLIGLAVLFICREIFAWYTKTNIQIENQEKMIALLKRLVENTNQEFTYTENNTNQ